MDSKFVIKTFEFLPLEYEAQVKNLSDLCFLPPTTEEEREEHSDKFWNMNKCMYVIGLEGDVVVSIVGLLKRKISYMGKEIVLGGFGGVCTQLAKRKQGFASALVVVGMNELKKAGCDMAYLCANVNDEHLTNMYKRVGFVVFGKPHSYYGKSGKIYTDHDAMLAPVNSRELFNLVMNGKEVLNIGEGNW